MQGYFASFIKTGDPNMPGLPSWAPAPPGGGQIMRQTIDLDTRSVPFAEQARYEAAIPLLESRADHR